MLAFIILAFLFANEKPVTFKTVSFWNEQYFIPYSHYGLNLDIENGDDIFSEVYCEIAFKAFKENNSHIIKPTLGLNNLEIGIDLKNNTSTYYQVDKLVIKPVGKSEVKVLSGVSGKYNKLPVFSRHKENGTVLINIDDLSNDIIYHPDKLTIDSKENITDERISIKIVIDPNLITSNIKLYQFNIEIHLIALNEDTDPFIVVSDKIYSLAINQ